MLNERLIRLGGFNNGYEKSYQFRAVSMDTFILLRREIFGIVKKIKPELCFRRFLSLHK